MAVWGTREKINFSLAMRYLEIFTFFSGGVKEILNSKSDARWPLKLTYGRVNNA